MNSYELYNRVIETKDGDEGTFNACARNWIEGTEKAPFENEEALELYAAARHLCKLWRGNAINAKISKRRMIANVKKIADMNLPNPYDPNEKKPEVVEETPAVAELVKAEEEKKEETKVHILGVLPDQEEKVEKKVEAVAEEPEKKHFFGKQKKR